MRHMVIRITIEKIKEKLNNEISNKKAWKKSECVLSKSDITDFFNNVDNNILKFAEEIRKEVLTRKKRENCAGQD